MKKKFIEPEIKRIELNLNENIASSHEEGYNDVHMGAFNVCHTEKGCLEHVHKTDISYDQIFTTDRFLEIQKCLVGSPLNAARILGLPITSDMY